MKRRTFNPSPLGTLSPSGASAQVLLVLAGQPQRFFARWEIERHLAQQKSIDWALRHAQHMGWIESASDHRSNRYKRYRITTLGMEVFA